MTPAEDGIPAAYAVLGHNPAQEELQVRQTAQRLLAEHLQLPEGTSSTEAAEAQGRRPSPWRAFWPGMSLDLTGATLVGVDFRRVSVVEVRFDGATFQGLAGFGGATFHGDAGFNRVTFQKDAWFAGVTFQKDAWFAGVTFQGDAVFGKGIFRSEAGVLVAGFYGESATFQGYAGFSGATFHGRAVFGVAIFKDSAGFSGATFQGEPWFAEATFQKDAGFSEATFQGAARFDGLHFYDLVLNKDWVWPDGYTVLSDPADPMRGRLVYTARTEEPKPAVPPPDPTADNGLGTG